MHRSLSLAAAVTLVACGSGPDSAYDGPPRPSDWIGDVFADDLDTPLGGVLLPGGHNATSYACAEENGLSPDSPPTVITLWGTGDDDNPLRQRVVDWARTQDRTIGQQLKDGLRAFELRFTLKDGVLTTWHSVYGVPADEVFDDLVHFAVAHPDEIVVLEIELDVGDVDWEQAAAVFTAPRADGASFCDRLYDGADNAALATLGAFRERGRNLVWSPDAELRAFLAGEGCSASTVTIDQAWSITTSTDGVQQALADSVPSRDPAHLLQNDFVFSLDGSATSAEQAGYVVQYATLRDANQALGFTGDFPGRLIASFDDERAMSVFFGDLYEDTNLVAAAIDDNVARAAASP